MTFCKHFENRIIPIQYQKSDENICITSDIFGIYLLNNSSLVLEMNGKECFLNGKVVICTNNLDEIKLLHKSNADIEALCFAPEFININLNFDIVRSIDYDDLCKKHLYPDLGLFLKRSSIYNGILLLDEYGHEQISEQLSLIEYQLLEQPDHKWSCRSRSYLFQIINILTFYYNKYVGNPPQDFFVWNICRYINTHLGSDLSIKYLSKHFSVNRTTLSEKFKLVMKMTTSDYNIKS